MSPDHFTTYAAIHNDLYEVVHTGNGDILSVTIYPDNNGRAGEELYFWQLPEQIRARILKRIEETI